MLMTSRLFSIATRLLGKSHAKEPVVSSSSSASASESAGVSESASAPESVGAPGSAAHAPDSDDLRRLQAMLDVICPPVSTTKLAIPVVTVIAGAAETRRPQITRLEAVQSPAFGDTTHVIFFTLGFHSEGKETADVLSDLISATDARRVAIVRVHWDNGDLDEVHHLIKEMGLSVVNGQNMKEMGGAILRSAGPIISGTKDQVNFHKKHNDAKSVGVSLAAALVHFVKRWGESCGASPPSDSLLHCGAPALMRAESVSAPHPRIILMGHSLGGRVTLHALQALGAPVELENVDGHSHTATRDAFVEHAVLFAAAQRGPEGERGAATTWKNAARAVKLHIYNVYNEHDAVLLGMMGLGAKLVGVDVLDVKGPAGARAIELHRHGPRRIVDTRLVNVVATSLIARGHHMGHSYKRAYSQILKLPELRALNILSSEALGGAPGEGES